MTAVVPSQLPTTTAVPHPSINNSHPTSSMARGPWPKQTKRRIRHRATKRGAGSVMDCHVATLLAMTATVPSKLPITAVAPHPSRNDGYRSLQASNNGYRTPSFYQQQPSHVVYGARATAKTNQAPDTSSCDQEGRRLRHRVGLRWRRVRHCEEERRSNP